MLIGILTDTHFGCRNDASIFDKYFSKFYNEIFFPVLKDRKINTVLHLGDVFDRRKYINYVTLNNSKEYFFNKFKEKGIKLIALVGNHDSYYKNTNQVNSLDLLLQDVKNISIVPSPTEWNFDDTIISLIPWICPDNFEQTIDLIRTTKATLCFGHLELAGFEMHRGSPPAAGLDSEIFDKFEMVASGHFHHKSHRKNIRYVGSVYQQTWADYDDERGFHIFDTDTHEFEYIKNPYQIFNKIYYDDKGASIEAILERDLSQYKDTYVKVVIINKTNPYWFDMLIDKLTDVGVFDLQTVENSLNLEFGDDEDLSMGAEDTLSILSKYVSQLEVGVAKERLDNLFKQLYNDSLNLE